MSQLVAARIAKNSGRPSARCERQCLARPALRICVSAAVAEALSATGRVIGPIVVIESGIKIGHITGNMEPSVRSGVFIAGYKAPDVGRAIAVRLRQNVDVDLAEVWHGRVSAFFCAMQKNGSISKCSRRWRWEHP
jgi:hypothetical protein